MNDTPLSVYDMDWTTIMVAFIGLLGIISGAYFSYLGQKASGKVNDAVNNRHQDHPKLYDLVLENHAEVRHLSQRLIVLEAHLLDLPCSNGKSCDGTS